MVDVCEIRCIHQDSVNRALAGRTDEGVLDEAAALLGVISDPTRLKIMDALRLGELCVCDLAAVLSMSISSGQAGARQAGGEGDFLHDP